MAGKRYLVKNGINYPSGVKGEEKRAEAGETVDDIPERDARWLEKDGHIAAEVAESAAESSVSEKSTAANSASKGKKKSASVKAKKSDGSSKTTSEGDG